MKFNFVARLSAQIFHQYQNLFPKQHFQFLYKKAKSLFIERKAFVALLINYNINVL